MDFEDRLRDQMRDQSGHITIEPEGVDAVADRSRARRQRRITVAVAAALVIVAGMAGFLVGQNSGDPVEVATEGSETDGSETSAAAADDPAGTEPVEEEEVETALPEPGSALQFTNIESADSPGGYNAWQNGIANGIYYVLSTAPGTSWDDVEAVEGEEYLFRSDTIYTWDEGDWSTSDFGDRYVTSLESGPDGLLYTVSTGSDSGAGLAVGVSDDAGRSWEWTPIDLSDAFGTDTSTWPGYQTLSAHHDGQRLVMVHRSPGADWDQALTLARENGVDIDGETDEVINIDGRGISWIPDLYEVSPCQAAVNDFYESQEPELAEDPPFDFEREPTPEEQAAFDQWIDEMEARWEELQRQAVEYVRGVEGCEDYAECMVESAARLALLDEQLGERFRDLERRAEAGEEISPEEWEAAELAASAVYDEYDRWLEETECGRLLHGEHANPEEQAVEYVAWADLGVTVPDHWNGVTRGYLVETSGAVQDLGDVFAGEDGYLISVNTGDDGFEVVFDATERAADASGVEPRELYTTWTSADGRNWSSTTSTEPVWWLDPATVGGFEFTPDWEREDEVALRRTDAAGTTDVLRLTDLAPGLETRGYHMNNVESGPYGVVAWATRFEDGPSYRVDTIVLYSPDGIGWGATPLPGVDVVSVIVGDSGVMLFVSDPELANSDTPQPVLFGTA